MIFLVEKRLVEEVRSNDILIIVGETGSGKTTQIPQFLFNAGFCHDGKIIGITQPRRVAAVSVARRVAEECGVELGQRVGYSVRFDDMTSNSTRIKYMTDGLLLREALLDQYLSRYSVIIVDEAHERTVPTDVLLGLLKSVQKLRSGAINQLPNIEHMKPDNGVLMDKKNDAQRASILKQCRGGIKLSPLKLIIMSASLDACAFSKYFGDAKAVHVQGRQFPVDILYTRHPETDYVDAALITIFQIHLEEGPGDILVFLTGQEEIESSERLVKERLRQLPEDKQLLKVLSIFSSLPSEKQMQVFMPAPTGFRKVILATNIAETSVTIPGIKYVIDPGLVKARQYSAHTGMESLIIVPTSKAQALSKGVDVQAVKDLASAFDSILRENLKNSRIPHFQIFCVQTFQMSFCNSRLLVLIIFLGLTSWKNRKGALTDEYKLSDPVGHQMARLPLDPTHSKALILASQFNCLEEMLIAVAMLSVESIFYTPREKLEEARTATKCFSSLEGDHQTLVNVYRASDEFFEKTKMGNSREKAEKNLRKWCKENFINSRSLRHARDIHRQIRENVEHMGLRVASCGDETIQFRRCLAATFFLNAALKQPDGTYKVLSSGQTVQIHPTSVLFRKKAECIIFDDLLRTNNNYMRNVTRIDYLWLPELAPQYYALKG
ncbi:RNA helicase family protein [Actinidia rufa]|uniref:RNA helicase n=1 Tax=Actinidia rufa TaxID=165716 RepID=A0A7J0G2M2_9ERIC|nr:RNA helicase family protein [Actinidia rufa]